MFKDEIDDAFDVDAPVRKNTSVRDYQYFSYNSQDPNTRSRIELRFDDTAKYFLPCEAFIEVEGVLTLANGNVYPNPDTTAIGFVNNGIIALFNSARYIINGREIEAIDENVEIVTTILGLMRHSDDYSKTVGPSMMFHNDTTDHPDHIVVIMSKVRNAAGAAEVDAVVS